MTGIFCPECGSSLKLGARLHLEQRVTCTRCGSRLTVVKLEPVELDVVMVPNAGPNSKQKVHTADVPCPECDRTVKLSAHAREGQRVKCDGCNTVLEVVNTDPLELDVALLVNFRHNRR